MPESGGCHGCVRRDAQIERLMAHIGWLNDEMARCERDCAELVRARDEARKQRDVECARADRILKRHYASLEWAASLGEES